MKLKITLKPGQTPEHAEELLEKALKAKNEFAHQERYADQALNEFHDYITDRHAKLVESILKEIEEEIQHARR